MEALDNLANIDPDNARFPVSELCAHSYKNPSATFHIFARQLLSTLAAESNSNNTFGTVSSSKSRASSITSSRNPSWRKISAPKSPRKVNIEVRTDKAVIYWVGEAIESSFMMKS